MTLAVDRAVKPQHKQTKQTGLQNSWLRDEVTYFVCVGLTNICLMDYAILIYWTSPFLILEVSGVLFFIFILIFD